MSKNCATCDCANFIRADLQIARAITNINNMFVDSIMPIRQCLVDLVDLFCAVNPTAEEIVRTRREEMAAELAAQKQAAIDEQMKQSAEHAELHSDEGALD